MKKKFTQKLLTGSIKKIITNSAKQTQSIAKVLAEEILKSKYEKRAIILALSGELGAGKTTFLQGFAMGLGIDEKINSPTFVIMKRFEIEDQSTKISRKFSARPSTFKKVLWFKNFYHLDCYRLNDRKEILDLGFKEIISNPENIIAIEWGELIKKILPKDVIKIEFRHLEGDKREILIDIF